MSNIFHLGYCNCRREHFTSDNYLYFGNDYSCGDTIQYYNYAVQSHPQSDWYTYIILCYDNVRKTTVASKRVCPRELLHP